MDHLGFASLPAMAQYYRYAEHKQLDTAGALRQAGIDPKLMQQENGRVKGEQFQAFIHALLEQSDDPLLGLHSGNFVQPGSYSVLGYITMSCSTLGEAIERIAPYEKLVGDMGVTTVTGQGGQLQLTWQCAYSDPLVRPHMIDNVFASWTNYARWLSNSETNPAAIFLEHPEPYPGATEEYGNVFGCPITFDHPSSQIMIPHEMLALPLRQPDKLLLKTLEEHAQNQISTLEEQSLELTTRVKNCIRVQLKQGISRKDMVAEQLGLTARTLQRKLVAESSSYQHLLDEVRRELAEDYLLNSPLPLSEIAYRLGFAEARSFHRSFKSWTDMTPGEFREKHQR